MGHRNRLMFQKSILDYPTRIFYIRHIAVSLGNRKIVERYHFVAKNKKEFEMYKFIWTRPRINFEAPRNATWPYSYLPYDFFFTHVRSV